MKKLFTLCCVVLVAAFLSTECSAAPKSAVLIDKNSGRVLFELNKDEPLPMASTTKIMTALITLEEDSVDEFFTVDEKAIMVEGSSMGLKKGDRVTLRALAAGMLLASGNDAANAAAVKIAGSVDAFVKQMNRRAEEMGLKNTSFRTPSGLDGENHFSTAYEMALLAKNALANPDFAALCGAKTYTAEYGNPPYRRKITNHNKLLSSFKGATGVKTGFTKKAGRCLVSSAEREGISLICVTLNCPDDWNYHSGLYEEYFKKLKTVSLSENVPEIKIPVCGGEKESVCAVVQPFSAALLDGEAEKIKITVSKPPFVLAPAEEGEILGKVIFTLDEEKIGEVPITAKDYVPCRKKDGIIDKIKDIF